MTICSRISFYASHINFPKFENLIDREDINIRTPWKHTVTSSLVTLPKLGKSDNRQLCSTLLDTFSHDCPAYIRTYASPFALISIYVRETISRLYDIFHVNGTVLSLFSSPYLRTRSNNNKKKKENNKNPLATL